MRSSAMVRRFLAAPATVAVAIAVVATAGVLAGCGGQSDRDQIVAVARAYDRAILTGNERAVCSLVTATVRHEFSCGHSLTFPTGPVHDGSALHPTVIAVRVHGVRASATVRSEPGVATFPLLRESHSWRVAGPMQYLSRTWLQADYRLRNAGGRSAESIASIVDDRAKRIVGAPAHARDIGPDEIRVTLPEPVRLTDLGRVTRRQLGRLAFYDWEADVLTPSGVPVSEGLGRRDGAATLISQGSGIGQPGASGGMPLQAAVKLAAAQREVPGVRRRWTVVAGSPPSHREVVAGADPRARYFVLRDRPVLSRSDITDAYVSIDADGHPEIGLRFTPHGARAFHRLSAEIARRGASLSTPETPLYQHIATVLDGRLLSVIYVNHHVYPHGIPSMDAIDIDGWFTTATAYRLAADISAPPLPADLQLIHTTTVTGPG